jgi:hypothetical protein
MSNETRADTSANADHELARDRALLVLLIAASERAVEAFQASNNILDRGFVEELKGIIARSHQELAALNDKLQG